MIEIDERRGELKGERTNVLFHCSNHAHNNIVVDVIDMLMVCVADVPKETLQTMSLSSIFTL
ncbi:hypothetical protein GNZ12_04290 [Paraburkholderia sp. 1N]|uniref:Uncharacterized protein n=1 Tax=Paraburkholderia solitsugae TaxID=2675748 RepID=A0ABX2BKT0_9BURK|nr:hypothetical protein [Paraburkholderia solitsugae]NPT40541.1 hypothetical protein [Paraburkholderia solitsugae]